jgi:hypothetical protein
MEILENIGRKISNLKFSSFLTLLILILIIRNGLSPIGEEYVGWIRQASLAYPDPVHYLISSPLPILLMKILGYPSNLVWWGVSLIIFFVWIYISIRYISQNFQHNRKLVTLLFLFSTPVAGAMSMIGHIDIYTLIGATIAVFGKFRGHILLGAVLAAGGNSDQAIATTACLAFLSLGGSKLARSVFYRWAFIAFVAYFGLHLLVNIPSNNDPKKVMIAEIGTVIVNSLSVWHFLIYAFLGILWIPWYFIVYRNLVNGKEKFFTAAGVILLPFAMSFFILDGTRVGATVGYVTLLISFKDKFFDRQIPVEKTNFLLGSLVVYLILIPNIIVDSGGGLRIPIAKFLEVLFP